MEEQLPYLHDERRHRLISGEGVVGKMRFDLFSILDHHPELGETSGDVINRVLNETVDAEHFGFDGCWYAEHHFTPYGVCPSPPILLAAAAACTQRVRLGAAVSVLPLNNPIRIAEDYTLVDILSHGRLDLGVGSGYLAHETAGFSVPIEEKRERFDEALEILLQLWSERPASYDGHHFQIRDLCLNVRPSQAPHPPLWIAVVRPQAVRPVARRGLPIMLIPYAVTLRDPDLALFAEAYRNGYVRDPAHVPGLTVAYHAFVGATTQGAEATVLPYLRRYIDSRVQHVGGSTEEILDQELAIVGDPRACIDRIRRLQACGVTHLLLIMSFGGMPGAVVRQSLDLFTREVIPAFRSAPGSSSHEYREPVPMQQNHISNIS